VGDFEAIAPAIVESKYEIPPLFQFYSYPNRDPVRGQCLVGSLTGAVAS
jgi:hypothetical protein